MLSTFCLSLASVGIVLSYNQFEVINPPGFNGVLASHFTGFHINTKLNRNITKKYRRCEIRIINDKKLLSARIIVYSRKQNCPRFESGNETRGNYKLFCSEYIEEKFQIINVTIINNYEIAHGNSLSYIIICFERKSDIENELDTVKAKYKSK